MKKIVILFFVWMIIEGIAVQGRIENDGICAITTFVPFTYLNLLGTDFTFYEDERLNNLGFSHMVAAIMAMEHFNERDDSVVPELREEVYTSCNIKFDLNNSRVLDTGSITHRAGELMLKEIQENGVPCAIAGPYNDLPAMDLSVYAASAGIPLVAHRAFNLRVSHPFYGPYSSQVYPDLTVSAEALVSFLKYKNRTNYISILYNLGDTSTQNHEIVSITLGEAGIEHKDYRYLIEESKSTSTKNAHLDTDLTAVFQKMKKDGYRTIVAVTEFPEVEAALLAQAAEEAGMNNGDYFWIFIGVDLSVFTLPPVGLNFDQVVVKFLAGSALLSPLEGFQLDIDDNFLGAWRAKNETFVDRVNSFHSIPEGMPGYYHASPLYFQLHSPVSGAGFMYDAIMAVGMGACLSKVEAEGVVNGTSHVDGIRSTAFSGASGRVVMTGGAGYLGVRNASFVKYGVVNLFPPLENEEFDDNWYEKVLHDEERGLYFLSDAIETHGGTFNDAQWSEFEPFIFRDGRTLPPDLLRATPEQNYLKKGMRAAGLSLMSVAMFACTASALWVFVNRKHRIVRAAQPYSLYLVCLGSFITTLTLLPLSFDESYGWSTEQLSRGCMSIPWLVSMGNIITYGALFSKLWRVNKVLQFHRTTVQVRHVAWPAISLIVAAIAVTASMTAINPLEWVRVVIDADTGESIGRCDSDYFGAFLWPLAILMVIPMVMTGFMAWKTNDVDEALSESKWIFALIVVQIEVIILATPLVTILRDVNTNGRYFGVAILLWSLPASTICLIMLPKMIAHRRSIRGTSQSRTRGSGGAGSVYVTGLSSRTESAKVVDNTVLQVFDEPEKRLAGSKEHTTKDVDVGQDAE